MKDCPEGYIEYEMGGGTNKAFFTARDVVFGHGSKFNYPWFEAGDWVDCYIKDGNARDVKYYSSPPHFARRLKRLPRREGEEGAALYLDLGDTTSGATAGDDDEETPLAQMLSKPCLNLYLVRRDRNVKEKA